MARRSPLSPAPEADATALILDAARDVVAERGLGQLSLRAVAECAGVSVGSISYRIGDRAALVAAIARREGERAEAHCRAWESRVGAIAVDDGACLGDVVIAWLRQGAGEGRRSAVVQAELVSAAYRDPALLPAVSGITARHCAMWRTILAGWAEPDRLARRIASYCIDERPFTILLDGCVDYALLRASTVRGLLRDPEPSAAAAPSDWHMRLVALLEAPARAAFDASGPPQGAKGAIAERIADLIMAHGLELLSHRMIAQAMGMPPSSVAHHFPTQRDILLGGVETLYRHLREEIRDLQGETQGTQTAGSTVVALGHEVALRALREPAFQPFAIDMRRRRAENVHAIIAGMLGAGKGTDRAVIQAYVMALIGMGLGGMTIGRGSHGLRTSLEAL